MSIDTIHVKTDCIKSAWRDIEETPPEKGWRCWKSKDLFVQLNTGKIHKAICINKNFSIIRKQSVPNRRPGTIYSYLDGTVR